MNRPDRFWRSIDVLATAYLEGHFRPYDCTACGVGNLIAADLDGASTSTSTNVKNWPPHSGGRFVNWREAKNVIFGRAWSLISAVWAIDFEPAGLIEPHPLRSQLLPVSQYSVTDVRPKLATNLSYTTAELLRIEAALLEKTEVGPTDDELFEGLMAVVDVLFEIHEVEDEDLRGEAKGAFENEDYNTVESVLA